jgi:hypothetical protein
MSLINNNVDLPIPNGDLKKTFISVNTMFAELYANAQFQEAGKGLSSNDFTDSKAYQYGRRCRKNDAV